MTNVQYEVLVRVRFGILSCSLLLASCGGGGGTTVTTPVASVSLSQTSATLAPAATLQLSATPKDASGTALTGRTVTWSTTAAAVATVNGGLVTAVAPGSATITATSEGQSANAVITVSTPIVPVATVTLSVTSATLVPGGGVTLVATTKDAGGATLTGRAVTWGTSAGSVASVSTNGVVTAVGVGTAIVTATSETRTANAAITVVGGAVIGAAGGTAVSSDGNASIVIPAGALAQNTNITIVPAATVGDPQAVAGTSYSFGPSGTQFAAPATLTFKYSAASVPAGKPQAGLRVRYDSAGSRVKLGISIVDSVAHTVQSTTTHFTDIDIGEDLFLFSEASQNGLGTQYVTICKSAFENLNYTYNGPPPSGAITATSSDGAVVLVGLPSAGVLVVYGVAEGAAYIKVQGGPSGTSVTYLSINVVALSQPICRNTPFVLTEDIGGFPNTYIYDGSNLFPFGAANNGRSPLILDVPSVPLPQEPVATHDPTAKTFNIYFGGTGSPPVVFPLGGGTFQGGVFISPTNVIGTVQNLSGTSNIISFLPNGTQVQLTNFGGLASGVTATSTNKLYYNWRPTVGLTHINTIQLPTTGLPVTGPNTQVNIGAPTGEFSVAPTPDDHWLAYGRTDGSNYIDLAIKDLTTPGAPLIQVTTPGTGVALSPTWCGTQVLYYVYGGSFAGPFVAMRYNRMTGVSAPFTRLAGKNIPEIHFPTTVLEDGLHPCPQ